MTIEEDIALFERVPTLGGLGRDALRILAIFAESRHLHRGQVLFTTGEPADAAYVIQEGSLSLASPAAQNAGKPLVVGRGTLIGELALLIESKRPATATALEASRVLRIGRPVFLKVLDGLPEIARKLREIIARRNEEATADISVVGTRLDSSE